MRRFHRRSILKGLLGGAAVTVGLPPLERFMNSHGTAYADVGASGFPRRFAMFSWGNGHLAEYWNPAAVGKGADWELSEQLGPLAAFKEKMAVLTGYEVPFNGVGEPHFETACRLLVGEPLLMHGDDWTFSGKTFDQVMADEMGQDTRFPTLAFGSDVKRAGLSYRGAFNHQPAETNPFGFFERVFGGSFSLPGSGQGPDPRLALERSVLDSVMADIADLDKQVGAADKVRLEQHFEGIRAIEQQLAKLENPPELAACGYPDTPQTDFGWEGGLIPFKEMHAASAQIAAYALACDQTRVVSDWFSSAVHNGALFPGLDESHHSLTHFEADPQPLVHQCMLYVMESLGDFLGALDGIEEGDGTLLDHMVVLATSDCASGKYHNGVDFPLLLVGSADGRIVTDQHHRTATPDNATRALVTVARACGVDMPGWGKGEHRAETSISDVLVGGA